MSSIIQQFCGALAGLACEAVVVPDLATGAQKVACLFKERGLTKVVAWEDPVVDAVVPAETVHTTPAEAEVGITSAAWAVAETGTLALLSGPGRPRLVNVLPPLHIAVVPVSRLLPTMGALFRELGQLAARGETPSAVHMVTGPSRSADIEDVLVRKVHGPGEVIVVLVANQ